MPAGGTLEFTTALRSDEEVRTLFPDAAAGTYTVIAIRDTGVGMDETTLQRIYEPFFTTKEFGKGTGLGLSVVYGIVSGMNGFIDVRSAPGEGSTFSLFLPVAGSGDHHARQSEISDETPGGTETVLVIEDERDARMILVQSLEAKGYRVLNAGDGESALAIYRERSADIALVLSDLGLPKMDGFQCFEGMRAINPGVRMILASGFFDPRERKKMELSGVRLFVQKPYSVDSLLFQIREILDDGDSPH